MSGLPWMKFEPAAWMSDSALSACSLAAQGLWIRMICIMHDSGVQDRLIKSQRRAIEHQADVIHEMLPDVGGPPARDEAGAT